MKHSEIAGKQELSRKCSANDLILVREGLQCANCFAVTNDHGKTWKEAKDFVGFPVSNRNIQAEGESK